MKTLLKTAGALALVAMPALAVGGCVVPGGEPEEATGEAATQAPPEERDAVLAALQAVFDALERGDIALLREVLDPDIRMVYVETGADGTVRTGTSTLEELAARIEAAEAPLIERMWAPEVRVQGRIATVWTPYDFYVGERFSHCGIDVATLVRVDGVWRIVTLSWSRARPPACALHPEGPPAG